MPYCLRVIVDKTYYRAYGVSLDTMNHASSANIFMVGAGGPFAVGLSAYFGRLPVLFWWMVVALASAAGNAGASGYEGFLTTRVLNGFFATVAQAVSFSYYTLKAPSKAGLMG